jgi:WD40 repeat protein/Leucine-rich repeat (LRR) protein
MSTAYRVAVSFNATFIYHLDRPFASHSQDLFGILNEVAPRKRRWESVLLLGSQVLPRSTRKRFYLSKNPAFSHFENSKLLPVAGIRYRQDHLRMSRAVLGLATQERTMRCFVFLNLLGLVLALPQVANSGPAEPQKGAEPVPAPPTLVVRFKPLDDWLTNLDSLAASMESQKEAGKKPSQSRSSGIKRMLQSRLGPKGLQGLDLQRPLGLYAKHRTDGPLVVLLPISGEEAFLDLLARAKLAVKKGDQGIHNLAVSDAPFPVYFRFAHRHAYFTWGDPALLAQDQLLEPERVTAGPIEKGLLVASLRIDQLPETLKKETLAAMKQSLAENQKQSPKQTDALTKLLGEELLQFGRKLVEQGREAEFRLDDQWELDCRFTPQPKSPLAADVAALGQAKSRFAGLGNQDAFFTLTITLPASTEISKALSLAFEDLGKEQIDKEKDTDQRKNLTQFFEVLRTALTTQDIDLAIVVRSGAKDYHYSFIAGQKVKDSAMVERAFRDLVGKLPETRRKQVLFDAGKAGAIAIHRIDRQFFQSKDSKDKGEFEKYLGDNPVYFVAAQEALFLAGGDNGLAKLKEALALPPGPCPAFRLRFPLAFLALKSQYGLSVEGGDTLKIRFEGLSLIGQGIAAGFYEELDRQERAQRDAAEPAVAALKKLGATVVRDKRPGQPVVQVSLLGPKATDASLVYLKDLPQLETLTINSAQITDGGLAQLEPLKQLRSLHIGSQIKLTEAGLAHIKGLTKLQTLTLSSNKSITDGGLAHLAGLRELESLDLSFTPIKGPGLVNLKEMTRLRKLNLFSTSVQDDGLSVLESLPRLEELNLGQTSVTGRGLAHMKNLAQLETLALNWAHLSDVSLANLEGLNRLKTLNLLHTKITDAGLPHLQGLKELRELFLTGTKITDAGLVYLRGLNQLQGLHLNGTKIGDTGLSKLTELVQLQTLDLAGTRVTDAGLVHLQGLRKLQRLNLDSTEITDAGLVSIKRLDNLKSLDVGRTEMTDRGVAELRKALPRIYISSYGVLQVLDQDPKTRIIRGHTGPVTAVAFSADGEKLFSAGLDGSVRESDVETGEPNVTRGGKSGIHSLAITGNGETLAWGSSEAVLWEPKEIHFLKGHSGLVTAVALTKEGKLLASGSEDKTIKLWDVPAATERTTLKGHTQRITGLAFSPDGKIVASASADGTIKLWDSATGTERATLPGHSSGVTFVAFSVDGQTLASAGSDGTIKLWDVAGNKERATFIGHAGAVTSVAFSPDGKNLASGSEDKTVKLWEQVTGKEQATFKGHTGAISAVAVSPDGKTLASGSKDRTVRLWTIGGRTAPPASGYPSPDAAMDAFIKALLELDPVAYKKLLAKNPESRGHFHSIARGRRGNDAKKSADLADREALELIRSQLLEGQTLRYPVQLKGPDLAAIVCFSRQTFPYTEERERKFLFAKVNDQWYQVGHSWWTSSQPGRLTPRRGEPGRGTPAIPPAAKITPFNPDVAALPLTPEEARARLAKMKLKPTFDAGGRITAINKHYLNVDEWRAVSPLLSPDLKEKQLTFLGHLLTDADLEPLRDLSGLERLDVMGPTQVTDKGLAHLGRLKNLKELSIQCPYATAAGLEALRFLGQLEKLVIQARITDPGLAPLWQLVKLKVLVLANNDIRGPGLEQLKYLQELEILDLSNNLLTNSGLDQLPPLAKLERLIVSNNDLGDAGLRPLGKLATLKSLVLTNNGITDAGLEQLSGLANLESLEIRRNRITGSGLAHLKELGQLTGINLRDNPLADVALEQLGGMLGLGKPRPFGSSVEITLTAGISQAALDKFKKTFPKASVHED